MAMFYNIILFFYITIISISNVYGDHRCLEIYSTSECAYEMFCEGVFTMNRYLNEYTRNDNLQEEEFDRIVPSTCNLISAIDDNGYERNNFYPVHLTYKGGSLLYPYNQNINRDYMFTPLITDNRRSLALITSMNLSNNDYQNVPDLQKMDNLVNLILSNNSLTVAKLSNVNELRMLTEIIFSHNTISDVQYDSDEHIYTGLEKIDLSYNYLTKISDAVFDPFDRLEILDVSHNYIDTLGPMTFEGTKNLIYLNISHNRISDINSSLMRFIKLKQLDLSNNKIKNIKASDFNQLINLKRLNLHSNLISVIERDSFHNMVLLNSLYLNNNKLGNMDKDSFNNNSQLIDIDISENNFRTLQKGLLKNKNIRVFSIKANNLEGSLVKGTFEGLSLVTELDLSNQHLDSIDDYAFYGLSNIKTILLNNNNIKSLSAKSFRMIGTLKELDLSYNYIVNIEFEKDDLVNLLTLSLRNNHLTVVKQNDFHGLHFLQFLDLSDNKITQVEINSFNSLKELINFQISNNPLSGTLKDSTFDGLNSLPSLDISCTLLSTVQNGSFIGMVQLTKLNVSHSKINTLEHNIFIHTGAIESIDLSFNELKEFNINSSELVRLNILYLNNNLIKSLDSATFQSMSRLDNLHLQYNKIQKVDAEIFTHMEQLHLLDVSYNSDLKLTVSLLNKTKNVDVLNLSGIKTGISFDNIKDVFLSHLTIANSSVSDVKLLKLNNLHHLDTLSLSCNDITKLESGGFNNLSTLKNLDVSYNKIAFIQPGVFRDNVMLQALNVSHNYLTAISYGVFRGLIYLQTLDISHNIIKDLQNERFYEVSSLSVLIADNNKIESINAEEFQGTSLTLLSIGDNPIPCEILVNLKRREVPFQITASRLDESNDENIDGITCNKKSHALDKVITLGTPSAVDNILINIRDILLDHFNKYQTTTSPNVNEKYLVNVTTEIQKIDSDIKNISNYLNGTMLATAQSTTKNTETNILLNQILRVLKSNAATTLPPVKITKDNATYENLLSYINKIKQELEENMQIEKNSILNEIETKVSEVNSHVNHILLSTTEMPRHEKLTASADSKSTFTEICVALILIMLVCFVLFKIYKSRIYVRQQFSVSTRELPGAMDSTL